MSKVDVAEAKEPVEAGFTRPQRLKAAAGQRRLSTFSRLGETFHAGISRRVVLKHAEPAAGYSA
ncbi:MAG: hypothetical protein U5L06_04715 [Rhodovibrio sp.]|nr:hypothetical protein [Rhodovibrio sp.]